MTENALKWQTITYRHLTPVDTDVLIWYGINDSDGGLVSVGRLSVSHEYINLATRIGTPKLLPKEDFKNARWAGIDPPACVVKKLEKKRKIMEALKQREETPWA